MEWEREEVTDESIETLLDIANNPWFREGDVGTCIGLLSIVDQTRRLTFRNRRTRADLVPSQSSPSWPEKTRDVFLSVNGLLSVTTHSRKPKARHITAWLVRDVLPRMHKSVVTKHQAKIARHEVKLLANGVKIAYQQKELVALNKELSAVKKDLQTLRIRAMATTIKSWDSIIDKTTVKGGKLILKEDEDWDRDLKEERDRDQYECCPANLIKAAAVETI